MAEKIPGWLERVLLPQVNELKGEITAANAKIDGQIGEVKGELKAVDARMDGEFKALHSEIKGAEEKLGIKIDELDKRLDVTQRLAVVEERVKELLAKN